MHFLTDKLDLLGKIILLSLFSFIMSFWQYQSSKECNIISVDVKLRLLEKVKYGLWSDLKVFSRLLETWNWLTVGVEWSEPVKLFVERINDSSVKMMHILLHL